MIITRVKITNWRGIDVREFSLQQGLNLLQGDNEQGKTTVVEAIQKALYYSIKKRKSDTDRLDHIVPANQPTARPTVELELDFVDAQASVTKVIHPKPNHRECHLELRRGNKKESFSGEEAERKLAELINSMGDHPLLRCSEQERALRFLQEEPVPPAALHALSLGGEGTIVLNAQLEKIKQQVAVKRAEWIGKKPAIPLRECALARTAAHTLLKEIQQKTGELETARQALALVETLQNNITERQRLLAALQPQLEATENRLGEQRQRRQEQDKSERELREKKEVFDQLNNKYGNLHAQVNELGDLQRREGEVASACAQFESDLAASESGIAELLKERRTSERQETESEIRLADAKRRHEAITLQQDAVRLRGEINATQAKLTRVSDLDTNYAAAKDAEAQLGVWPKGEKIGIWREMHQQLIVLEAEARSKLQIDLRSSRPIQITWSSDAGIAESDELSPGEPRQLGAVRALRLSIGGMCEIDVRCGAKELTELLEAIDERRREIDDAICPFGVAAKDLPQGFHRLEEGRIQGEEAKRRVDAARSASELARQELGSPDQLQAALAKAKQNLVSCETKLVAFDLSALQSLDEQALSAALDKESELMKKYESECRELGRQVEALVNQGNAQAISKTRLEAKLEHSRSALIDVREKTRLILSEAGSDDALRARTSEAAIAVARADDNVHRAKEQREAHGMPVTDEDLAGLDATNVNLRSRISEIQGDLQDFRAELRTRCGNDLQGCAEELEAQIQRAQRTLLGEERRLAAVLFLDFVLAAERKRVAKLVSEPLNQRISPWLTQIRGAQTEIVIDEADGRIATVITYRDGKPIELPFEELSSGLKGQLALLVRLTLAAAMARQKGSRDFVILDDPLTDTSPMRRPEMFNILRQASEDLQILFVTCHEDVAATLPGTVNVLRPDARIAQRMS